MAILRKVLSSVGRAETGKESFLDEGFQIGLKEILDREL